MYTQRLPLLVGVTLLAATTSFIGCGEVPDEGAGMSAHASSGLGSGSGEYSPCDNEAVSCRYVCSNGKGKSACAKDRGCINCWNACEDTRCACHFPTSKDSQLACIDDNNLILEQSMKDTTCDGAAASCRDVCSDGKGKSVCTKDRDCIKCWNACEDTRCACHFPTSKDSQLACIDDNNLILSQ